ncbi:MAG: penicillin-binding protein 2 [SAR324 cluster bacterium]|nr:penicillin-binding protein 2 [SAR324 cluster bacterium]
MLKHKQLTTIKRRKFIYQSLLGLGLGALVLKTWDLQVLRFDRLYSLSSNNRIKIRLVPAPRGSIYDRTGLLLVTNSPIYNVTIDLEDVEDLTALLKKITPILKDDLADLRLKVKKGAKRSPFPILLETDIGFKEASFFQVFQEDFPGIAVESAFKRNYLFKDKMSHLLGFINWADQKTLAQAPTNKLASYRKIGRSGVESTFNDVLVGRDGVIQNEVTSKGLPIRVLDEDLPIPGGDVYLTINSKLQSFIYDKMPGKGSVVVMNANTSEIISMVSKPGFDPHIYVDGISKNKWQALSKDPDHSLIDRCLQGVYSPGSTFKMLIALAGLETGLVNSDTHFNCPGFFRKNRQVFHCWKRSGHGPMDMKNAIAQSCNVYFYHLARKLGISNIVKFARLFGFGYKTNINLPHEVSGLLPSPKWKLTTLKQRWLPGETINLGIGQGYLGTTPLQLINYINIIINNGAVKRPMIIKKIVFHNDKDKLKTDESTPQESSLESKASSISIADHNLELIKEGMYLCVNSKKGTGRAAKSELLDIYGKTGTTQVISSKTKRRIIKETGELAKKFHNHAWFVGYVPNSELLPTKQAYSIVVMLENADKSAYAAKFAKQVMEFYAQQNN